MSTLEQERKNEPLLPGYTIDEEGNFNIYAIEPNMYLEEVMPSQWKQRYSMVVAVILTVAVSIAFAISIS